jgi:hypothetical protein
MTKSGIILVFVSIMVVVACLSPSAFAKCATCGGEEDWSASANNFLEGKPINDTPSSLTPPQLNRLRNTDFNSSLIGGNSDKATNNPNSLAVTPTLDINLIDVRAMPNPVNSGSPVMITADFGNSSSKYLGNTTTNDLSTGMNKTNMTVYATIRNSAELDVGKVILGRTSGEEYAGIWNTNVIAGVYRATVVASASGASKTFKDVLKMDVSKAA